MYLSDYFLEELEQKAAALGVKPYRVRQVAEWVYKKGEFDFLKMTNLSDEVREKFQSLPLELCSLKLVEKNESKQNKAIKYLFQLKDGNLIETILLSAITRKTVCVSTQVGCPVACRFCASGKEGVHRNLETHEIVEQVLLVNQDLMPEDKIDNIVVMGMGEPFLNYDNLMKALRIINAHWGCEIGARHITVSTAGIIPGIQKFTKEKEQFCLAVSLHSAIDAKRTKIMPINETYPLPVLRKALEAYLKHKKRDITLVYTLMEGFNDQAEDIEALLKFIGKMKVKVNVIPLNRTKGSSLKSPSMEVQYRFTEALREKKIFVTLREEKGSDIDAACGQLRLRRASAEKA